MFFFYRNSTSKSRLDITAAKNVIKFIEKDEKKILDLKKPQNKFQKKHVEDTENEYLSSEYLEKESEEKLNNENNNRTTLITTTTKKANGVDDPFQERRNAKALTNEGNSTVYI